MRDYAKITPFFWIDEQGKAIRQYGNKTQLLAFYLLTCPQAAMIGIYYLPIPYIAHETKMSKKQVKDCLAHLSEVGFCIYDEASEYVWVVEMAKSQIGESLKANDNRIKNVEEAYQALPKLPFLKDFYDKYHEDFHLAAPRENYTPLGAPSKPLQPSTSPTQNGKKNQNSRDIFINSVPESHSEGSAVKTINSLTFLMLFWRGFEAPLKPLRSQEQEQEQEQEQDQNQDPNRTTLWNREFDPQESLEIFARKNETLNFFERGLVNENKKIQQTEEDKIPESNNLSSAQGEPKLFSEIPQAGISKTIIEIFEFWKKTLGHPTAKLDEKRKQCIRYGLKLGYSISQLCEAITGCSLTPHNMGNNDRGQRFDGLHIIFKNADNIERFIFNARSPPDPSRYFNDNKLLNNPNTQHFPQRRQMNDDFANKKYAQTPIESISWLNAD
jgi:hypothetical protein